MRNLLSHIISVTCRWQRWKLNKHYQQIKIQSSCLRPVWPTVNSDSVAVYFLIVIRPNKFQSSIPGRSDLIIIIIIIFLKVCVMCYLGQAGLISYRVMKHCFWVVKTYCPKGSKQWEKDSNKSTPSGSWCRRHLLLIFCHLLRSVDRRPGF